MGTKEAGTAGNQPIPCSLSQAHQFHEKSHLPAQRSHRTVYACLEIPLLAEQKQSQRAPRTQHQTRQVGYRAAFVIECRYPIIAVGKIRVEQPAQFEFMRKDGMVNTHLSAVINLHTAI